VTDETTDLSNTEKCEGTQPSIQSAINQPEKCNNMWRSFFMAVGVFLVLLGLETLVVDQFLMSNNRRIPEFITAKDGIFANQPPGSLESNQNRFPRPFQALSNQQSTYGPSRFQGTGFGRQSNYDLASFGRTTSSASGQNPPAIQVSPSALTRPQRMIQTKDWMPWSLLAAGTLIVLYVHSTRGSHSEH